MAETLASTLNQPVDPFSIVGQVSKKPGLIERGTAARSALEPMMRAEESASAESRRLQRQGAEKIAQGEVDLAQGEVRAIEGAQRAYTEAIGEAPIRRVQDFNPDAAMELAALTAIMGAFVGLTGGGGRGALAALEGVTTGYRQGDQDRYERELKTYESELQKYKDRISSAKQTYDNVIKLETARKGAGAAELKKLQTQIAGTAGEAQAKAGNFKEVNNFLKDAMQAADKAQQKLLESAGSSGGGKGGGVQVPAGIDVEGVQIIPGAGVPRVMTSIYEGLPKGLQESFARTEQTKFATERIKNQSIVKKARETLRDIDAAEIALNNIEAKAKAQKGIGTGGAAGMPIIGTPIQQILSAQDKDYADFDQVSNKLQRLAYVPGEGQISNYERELFQRANIGIGRPIETNRRLLEAYRAAAQQDIERSKFYERFFAANKQVNEAEEWYQYYLNQNPVLIDDGRGNLVFNRSRQSFEDFYGGKRKTTQAQQPAVSQQQGQSRGSLTADQVREQAELNNISVEEAAQKLRDRGYDIEEE
jgi:hypothetical protein